MEKDRHPLTTVRMPVFMDIAKVRPMPTMM